jgi:hypothetical protein
MPIKVSKTTTPCRGVNHKGNPSFFIFKIPVQWLEMLLSREQTLATQELCSKQVITGMLISLSKADLHPDQ